MHQFPELSLLVSKLPNMGRTIAFKADEDVLGILTDELGVERTIKFHGQLLARPWKKGGMALKGHVKVELAQACVVTSEPVFEEINLEIDRKFTPVGKTVYREKLNEEGELIVEPDAYDPPDEFTGDTVNIWEPILEEIVLELNPFPRVPDAEISAEYQLEEADDGQVGSTHSPFSELNSLINKKNSEN